MREKEDGGGGDGWGWYFWMKIWNVIEKFAFISALMKNKICKLEERETFAIPQPGKYVWVHFHALSFPIF